MTFNEGKQRLVVTALSLLLAFYAMFELYKYYYVSIFLISSSFVYYQKCQMKFCIYNGKPSVIICSH